VLYSDTINDKQVCRDDLWLATTEALNSLSAGASPAAAEKPTGDLTEKVRRAMIRAYGFGQTWWQQADSEYASENKRADVTAGRFIELTDELCAAIPANLATASQEGAHAAPTRDLAYLIEYIPDAAVRAEAKRLLAGMSIADGAHAARNAVLEEAANALDLMNDSAGDRAAHEQREMLCCENERMWTLIHAAKAIRALKTPACAERSGDHA
jgi:hypothetical protein